MRDEEQRESGLGIHCGMQLEQMQNEPGNRNPLIRKRHRRAHRINTLARLPAREWFVTLEEGEIAGSTSVEPRASPVTRSPLRLREIEKD
jgi:hypothetical protein